MLQGIRVLDLTWILGGPFAGQLLAQLGAEVIKIEPLDGDGGRKIGGHGTAFEGDSGFFLSANRGKQSIALDLKQASGLNVFYDLVRQSDAVIYAFSPGVPARLKIEPADLLTVNPRIVIAQMVGVDDSPPFDDTPAYDLILQALGGLMSITGEPDGRPVRVGYQIADLAGGLYLALACVGGLVKSLRSGVGAASQVSMLDCQLALLTWQAQNWLISGVEPSRTGARHPVIVPNDIYRCLDGGFLAICPTGEHFWQAFCSAIGRPELAADPRFSNPRLRLENVEVLSGILQDLFRQQPVAAWSDKLFEARVPAGKVNSVPEALAHPAALRRGMVETVAKPGTDRSMRFVGNPFKYDDVTSLSYPPSLGEHTRSVLSRVVGYSEERIEELVASGTIRC